MSYTLMARIDLMTAPRRQNYLVLELDRSKINGNTFYNLTACVERVFGKRKFAYTWVVLTEDKLVLFLSGNALQLDYILKYLDKRQATQLILASGCKSEFRTVVSEYFTSVPSVSYIGTKAVGGTHFARVGVAA